MRRRLNILPFVVKPKTPDRDLEAKLRGEWPQILAWAIAGCLEWQSEGLMHPESVAGATEAYFADQDIFGQWLDERCERGLCSWSSPRRCLSRGRNMPLRRVSIPATRRSSRPLWSVGTSTGSGPGA
jgi:putative DNA primase/helicase